MTASAAQPSEPRRKREARTQGPDIVVDSSEGALVDGLEGIHDVQSARAAIRELLASRTREPAREPATEAASGHRSGAAADGDG